VIKQGLSLQKEVKNIVILQKISLLFAGIILVKWRFQNARS